MCVTLDQFTDTTPVTLIEVDSELGLKIGLSSKVFVPISQCSVDYPYGTQLFRKGNCMYIQAIESWMSERGKHRHHLDKLLTTLWDLGFTIKVPNPVRWMEIKLEKKGFVKIDELNPGFSPPTFDVVMVKALRAGLDSERCQS
jgi:hypothetical protein